MSINIVIGIRCLNGAVLVKAALNVFNLEVIKMKIPTINKIPLIKMGIGYD